MSKYFIYTGNAYPHNNLNRLVEAVVSLNSDLEEPVVLKIASSRSVFTERLSGVVKKLGGEKYVELLGLVSDSELTGLYKNSVALVFTSLSEGFGIPGIEAMEAGTLVLASDIPVFREVYGKAATYFNPLDFSSIESAMRDALNLSGEERSEKVEFGKKFVKRYSWAKMAKETLKLYESSVGLRQS